MPGNRTRRVHVHHVHGHCARCDDAEIASVCGDSHLGLLLASWRTRFLSTPARRHHCGGTVATANKCTVEHVVITHQLATEVYPWALGS